MKEHLRWLVPIVAGLGFIFFALATSVCYGETTDELLNRSNKVRVVNDTIIHKMYVVQNINETKVWINIIDLEPMGIFHTRLIPGRYQFMIADYYQTDDEVVLENLTKGYFSLSENDLKNGYTIFLSVYPFDNQDRDWEGWR